MPDEIKTTIPPNPDAEFLPLPAEIGGVKLESYSRGREQIWQNVFDTMQARKLPDFQLTLMSWAFLYLLTMKPGKAAVASMNFEKLVEDSLEWRATNPASDADARNLADRIYTSAARWRVTTQDPSDPEGARSDDDNPKAPSRG